MAKIFIFRHGETTDGADGIFSGTRDCDLTQKGVLEVQKIGEALKNEIVTKAYRSTQLRSKKTLEIVLFFHPTIPIIVDDRIRERDYGDLTGLKKTEVERQNPEQYKLWHRSYEATPPNGESIKDVEVRVFSFIADLKKDLKPDDVVFISAHGNSIRPMRKYFEGLTNEEMSTFEHTPAKIYSYEV